MKAKTLDALILYYTERHHWAFEELRAAHPPDMVTFYHYLALTYERELMKLKRLQK